MHNMNQCKPAFRTRWGALLLAAVLLSGCGSLNHVFQPVEVQPVTFWWHFEPTQRGEWDYFTQVPHPYQSVPVLQPVAGSWDGPVVQQPPMLAARP